jgi:hypothetical protein
MLNPQIETEFTENMRNKTFRIIWNNYLGDRKGRENALS